MTPEPQPRARLPRRQVREADVDGFYLALTTLLRNFQFRDRDRQTICGITISQCYALDFIIREGRLTVTEIGHRLVLNKSNASRVVDTLQAKGLTTREPDTSNHRVRWIAATAKGRRLHDRIMRELKADYADLLSGYSADFVRDATNLLLAIAQRAGHDSKTRCQ